jgi:protein arginine N-methyltransferase 1
MSRTLREHYDFLSDRVRLEQFEAAIGQIIEPGHTVLDLGCGSGVLGLMALRAGAGKVYFVEEGPIIEVARQAIAESGCGARAEFFKVNSYELDLPEMVDTVICDHVGCFGFDYGILALLSDARQRFLKSGGIILPAELGIRLAPIESEDCRERVGKWRDGSIPPEFGLLGSTAVNTKYLADLEENELLSAPAMLATLRLGDETADFLSWHAEFTSSRDGTLDGLGGWFDCRLAGNIRLSNGPDVATRSHRPQVFLPIDEPVRLKAGDRMQVSVMARHFDDVIGWTVELPESGQRFAHNTFNGLLLDHEAITSASTDRVARLNQRGRARQIVLSYCDGRRTVAEVQALVQKEHPDLFPSAHATSSFIARVLSRDTSE